MPIKRMKFISRAFVESHPDWYFVFGDNEKRFGMGGQAATMRGEKNSIGVRTKRAPSIDENAYWSDAQYLGNVGLICADFLRVEEKLRYGRTVVIPSDGLGTGLSELPKRAPATLAFIEQVIKYLEDTYGQVL